MPSRPQKHRARPKAPPPVEQQRPSSAQRGYGRRWREVRDAYLVAHPLCVICHMRGILVAATVVDHRIPHKGDMAKFWDRCNWQSLCKSCHDTKTAREDGGFGRKPVV